MNIGMISFTQQGERLGERLSGYLIEQGDHATCSRCKSGELAEWTQAHFSSDDALIFIGASGIAVRAIAPHLAGKTSDPAVVVIDETGTYCVSLLSGHLGGANELTTRIASFVQAIPVITTATDRNGVFAVDSWAKAQGMTIANPERIKWVSARLLAGESVSLKSFFPIQGALPQNITSAESDYDILVTYRTRGRADALKVIAPVITLGIGCKKDTSAERMESAYQLVLKKAGCHPAAIKQVCSIDLKANEPGLLTFCRNHKLPFQTFSAAELAAVPGNFSGSAFVKLVTGVDNVCERSAVLGSGGTLLTQKNAEYGVTMALAIAPYTVHFSEGGGL